MCEGNTDTSDKARCRFCKNSLETPYHLLTECEAQALNRHITFEHEHLETPFDITRKQILEFIDLAKLEPFQEIIEYDPMCDDNDDDDNNNQLNSV